MKTMFEKFYGTDNNETFKKFKRRFGSKKFTTASLHQFFFQYRKSVETMMEKLDTLNDIIEDKVNLTESAGSLYN